MPQARADLTLDADDASPAALADRVIRELRRGDSGDRS
jgi:hypothetical protein